MSNSARRPGSEEEWEALLHQMQLQPKAQPAPFFYARVQARLLAPAATTSPWQWLRRPAYAAMLGAMILAISGDGSATASAPSSSPNSPAAHQSLR